MADKFFPSRIACNFKSAVDNSDYTGVLTVGSISILAMQHDADGANEEAVTIDPATEGRFTLVGSQWYLNLFGDERIATYDYLSIEINSTEVDEFEVPHEIYAEIEVVSGAAAITKGRSFSVRIGIGI